MDLETIRTMLAWCTVIDIIALGGWGGFFMFGRDFVYRLHSRWFPMPVEQFVALHYGGLLILKVCMIVFHLGPYLALRIFC
jgi:hypothetical protein